MLMSAVSPLKTLVCPVMMLEARLLSWADPVGVTLDRSLQMRTVVLSSDTVPVLLKLLARMRMKMRMRFLMPGKLLMDWIRKILKTLARTLTMMVSITSRNFS